MIEKGGRRRRGSDVVVSEAARVAEFYRHMRSEDPQRTSQGGKHS